MYAYGLGSCRTSARLISGVVINNLKIGEEEKDKVRFVAWLVSGENGELWLILESHRVVALGEHLVNDQIDGGERGSGCIVPAIHETA